jgi:bacterioferritin-associated ferredoxin
MIVCVCKSVSDRTIRASIADGMDSFDELQFELGVATCCGKCEESVRDVMAQSGVCASRCGVTQPMLPAVVPHVVPLTFYERKAA